MGRTATEWLAPYLIETTELAAGTRFYLAAPRADYLRGRYAGSNGNLEAVKAKKEEILEMNMLKTRISY
jgi:hypothetical protein